MSIVCIVRVDPVSDLCTKLHGRSAPHESIKSYSCCKSDMLLFTTTPSNCWMWLFRNLRADSCLPESHFSGEKSKAAFTTQLVLISFLCGGELMSGPDHLHHYFLIIYVMPLQRRIHAAHNRKEWDPHPEHCVCVAQGAAILNNLAIKCQQWTAFALLKLSWQKMQ